MDCRRWMCEERSIADGWEKRDGWTRMDRWEKRDGWTRMDGWMDKDRTDRGARMDVLTRLDERMRRDI